MISTSFRECSTMSTCSGAIALDVPASSSVPVFIATPCPISAEIAVLASLFRGRVKRLPRCRPSGRLQRRKPQPCLDAVQEFRKRNRLLGRPEERTHAKFQRAPWPHVSIEHGDALSKR